MAYQPIIFARISPSRPYIEFSAPRKVSFDQLTFLQDIVNKKLLKDLRGRNLLERMFSLNGQQPQKGLYS